MNRLVAVFAGNRQEFDDWIKYTSGYYYMPGPKSNFIYIHQPSDVRGRRFYNVEFAGNFIANKTFKDVFYRQFNLPLISTIEQLKYTFMTFFGYRDNFGVEITPKLLAEELKKAPHYSIGN